MSPPLHRQLLDTSWEALLPKPAVPAVEFYAHHRLRGFYGHLGLTLAQIGFNDPAAPVIVQKDNVYNTALSRSAASAATNVHYYELLTAQYATWSP